MLTLEELTAEVDAGTIDTVVCAFTDMQGRLLGKREDAHFFLARDGRARARGLQLPARARHGDGPAARLRDGELGARLRRLPPAARPRDAAPRPVAARGRRSCSATSRGRTARRSSPRRARCSRAQVERARAAGFEPMIGSELEFYLLKETYAEAHAKHYRELTPSVPVHPRLPRARDHLRRGLHPPDPQRRCTGAGIPVESSKGEAWPGQHEINFRYADALRMADNHVDLQERRQGDRARERLLDHVHGEARPHLDRQLVPHPREPLARRRERVRRRQRAVPAVPRRLDRVRARAGALPGAERSTRTSATPPEAGRRRRSRGGTTTARAASASSATALRSGSRRGSPAATSTRTSRSPR